ncbi:PfkB family carbohydrate kinase [Halospeciosus flavus]|uniref:PfkB family carbohydrate kinase n=1 Tax=Halospeciosus flavus TaxID=3032283 RepID=A0ABD5Z4E3_9EURY|nr:PfkB family carbohydrate kinase [Halospeciosus flavus]
MDVPEVVSSLDSESIRVVTLPDGSVDRRYAVEDNEGTVESRETFGRRIASGTAKSFMTEHLRTDPGGQAVNAAKQAHALGDDVTLLGHLDDPVLDELDVEGFSMGEPADVRIYEFEDGAVMMTDESPDIQTWTLDELRAVVSLDYFAAADAVVWTNWASVNNTTEALEALGAADIDGNVFVCDPGDVTIRDPDTIPDLAGALATLEDSFDVVLSANRAETRYIADALDVTTLDDSSCVRALRDELGITGVVIHASDYAVAARTDETLNVPNVEVDEQARYMGGGDRFSAALAHGLGAGWPWHAALALGNLAASYYIEYGETPSTDDLREEYGATTL